MISAHRLRIAAAIALFVACGGAPAATAQITRQPLSLNLPAQLPSSTVYATEDAFGRDMRFDQPVAIASPPTEKDKFFVVEKLGRIQLVIRQGSTYQKKQFMDLNAILAAKHEGRLVTESEMGLLGLAFHPDFARNGYFFVTYDFSVNENGRNVMFDRLSRFSVSKGNPESVDPDSEMPLITQIDDASNHNGGDIHFGPDGYLYYSMGDEGNQYDHYDNARWIDKDFYASIFRLDVDGKPGSLTPNPHHQASQTFPSAVNPGSYKVPADNPFVGATMHNGKPVDAAKLRTEIWACGFRNPWRFSFDPQTNQMFIGDVGQDRWEEVDIGKAGANYGWSYYEGNHEGPRFKDLPPGDDLTPPIYEYTHGEGSVFNGISVIGGVVYRGSRLPELNGTYIFGDYGTRHIWGLQQVGNKWVPSLLNTFGGVCAFGVDPANGDVLAVDLGGNIGRLVHASVDAATAPAVLSQTKAFSDLSTLAPSPGLVPYAPIVEGWAGGVPARRWFGISGGAKMVFNASGNWEFPKGEVWVQHFDQSPGGPKLETRFLVKTESGCYGISYKWRADQSDADLVPEEGSTDDASGWHYPARAECAACHSAVAGYAPSFNTWQLNKSGAGGGTQVNMVKALLDSGYLEDRNRGRDPAWPAYANIHDSTQPLEPRVRSYLAVNCAGCHQPGGAGLGFWDARMGRRLDEAKIVDGPLFTNFADPAARVIVSGDPVHSMLIRRLKADGVPKMPMGGPQKVDQEAVAMITQWVQQLPLKK